MERKRILNYRCEPNIVLYYDFFNFFSLKKIQKLWAKALFENIEKKNR